ncbi:monofunctional biosynthetic peptidoglycan transglycosylase [Myxococcota bacterium]|nr:monofunctional biosynthetic peptidoglycan transglycosylase [Myxococcota bacterium]MCZ7618254.1 monofunctional biosynthetic peptidoglycan transglycosylase [Myxococcota bacterium]
MRRWVLAILWRVAALALLVTLLPVAALRWVPPPGSAFMVQRAFGRGPGGPCDRIEYRWVRGSAISRHAKLAVLAAEDQRFARHRGFDGREIRAAFETWRRGGRARGASTISQQVAKNLFLWPRASLARKGLEAWFTLWIEVLWPKRRILEVYLNIAQMGRCTFGIAAASRRFFGLAPDRIGAHEAALLAAVLPNPAHRRADAPSPALRDRAARIRRQMPTADPELQRILGE